MMSPKDQLDLEKEFPWLSRLKGVSDKIVDTLYEKERHYQGSWQKRQGVGAFMMLARKMDRIEAICERNGYDIFKALSENDGDVGDDIDDLIGYLLLVRAESRRRAETTEYGSSSVTSSDRSEFPSFEVHDIYEDGTVIKRDSNKPMAIPKIGEDAESWNTAASKDSGEVESESIEEKVGDISVTKTRKYKARSAMEEDLYSHMMKPGRKGEDQQ